MSTTTPARTLPLTLSEALRPATLIVGWALAAGLAAALVIVIPTAFGRIHPDALVTTALAAAGAAFGALHGAVLARLANGGGRGRPLVRFLAALATALLGIGVAALAGGGLAISAAVARAGLTSGWVLLAVGILGSLAVVGWSSVAGWRAFESAYHRWPEHRLGARLLIGAFVLIVAALTLLRPVLPWTEIQVRPLALVVLAALATLWIALPAVVVGLSLARRPAIGD
jgi:hypothetical protein